MPTFRVGDRIRVRREYRGHIDAETIRHLECIVLVNNTRGIINNEYNIGVRIPGWQDGHTLSGILGFASQEGYWVHSDWMELVEPYLPSTWPPKVSKPKRYKDIEECFI